MQRFNSSSRRSHVAAVLAVFFLMTGAVAQAEAIKSQPSIKNFGQINENYFRGAQPENSDYADLADLGVRTIINLTSHDAAPNEQSIVENAGMKYVQIPMTTHEYPTAEKLEQFLEIVNDPASQPVYVHCVGGKHRTGVMTAVYRMVQDGWSADRAYKEMKNYKFGPSFLHPEFKRFVYDYYDRFMREGFDAGAKTTVAAGGAQ